jgi:hypothetical protein
MSKQEKPAALIQAIEWYERDGIFHVPHGRSIINAFLEYEAAPDDPPQKPEMPECVRELCELGEDSDASVRQLQDAAKAVRDHYRQPLKLEVGKVYEDDAGTKVQVVFENKQPGTKYPFLCVFLDTATPYYSDGFSLIREVKQ